LFDLDYIIGPGGSEFASPFLLGYFKKLGNVEECTFWRSKASEAKWDVARYLDITILLD